jgi:hypothetical protein
MKLRCGWMPGSWQVSIRPINNMLSSTATIATIHAIAVTMRIRES